MSIDDKIDLAIDSILYYPKLLFKYCFRKSK